VRRGAGCVNSTWPKCDGLIWLQGATIWLAVGVEVIVDLRRGLRDGVEEIVPKATPSV
jgi:hypothetical protein